MDKYKELTEMLIKDNGLKPRAIIASKGVLSLLKKNNSIKNIVNQEHFENHSNHRSLLVGDYCDTGIEIYLSNDLKNGDALITFSTKVF